MAQILAMRLAEAAGDLANIKFFFHLLAHTLFHSLVNYVRNHIKVVLIQKIVTLRFISQLKDERKIFVAKIMEATSGFHYR